MGFANVVAPLGTALTPDQCDCSGKWRRSRSSVSTATARAARLRFAPLALGAAADRAGRSLRFAFLPEGQDPDDLARQGGADAIGEVISAARPLVDVLLDARG